MGATIGNETCPSAFPARIWTDGWAKLRDWVHPRRMTPLGVGNRRGGLTPCPELSEPQSGHHRLRHFQDTLPPCPDPLSRAINHHSLYRGSVTGDRQHLDQHLLLEGLREDEGDQQAIGERGIGRQPLAGACFTAKIFQPAMRLFVRPPTMVAGVDGARLGPVGAVVDGRGGEHRRVHAQVGQHDVVGARKVQEALPIGFRHGPRVQCAGVPCPAYTLPAELQILPLGAHSHRPPTERGLGPGHAF